jgi:hypothetical protein
MKFIRRGAIVLGALAVVGASPVSGQGVEAIMRARETLALTDDQISRLDAIRREIVAQRSAEAAEMAELRSRLAAGQIRRSEMMAAQEDRQAAAEGRAEARRDRIDAVLTEEQRASVEQMRTRADRVRDRRQGFAPGVRNGVGRGGFRPGGSGPGRGPRGFGPR